MKLAVNFSPKCYLIGFSFVTLKRWLEFSERVERSILADVAAYTNLIAQTES